MTKEKQIEEMANAYYEATLKARGTLGSMNEGAPKWYAKELYAKGYRKASEVAELEAKLADVTANWQKIHDAYTADCIEHYNKGRSDVAREIFEEIEQEIKNHGICYAQRKIAELKKKYTESEKDNVDKSKNRK